MIHSVYTKLQVDSLGHLLGLARHTLVYAGCGLSTSAGVAQTARGHRFVEPRSGGQMMSDRSRILRSEKRTEAVPGLAHFTLTSLYKVWPHHYLLTMFDVSGRPH